MSLLLSQGQKLFFYHLSQAFFHERAKEVLVEAKIEDGFARISLTLDGIKGKGEAPVKLSLHKEQRRADNAALGLAFGAAAETFTSYIPPYGTLIGVRPVKVPLFYLEAGFERERVLSLLQEEFLVSSEKARLLLDLAETEREFQKALSPLDTLLYLSIPFCPSRCSYCSFISSAAPKHLQRIPDYLEQMKKEILMTAELFHREGRNLLSVYVGGGTPGILSAGQIRDLLSCVRSAFDTEKTREFCVEMGRPDTVTREKLDALHQAGVGRISINSQTTCDATLARIGRSHSADDFFRAMALAKEYPFQINCDLIAALPGEDEDIFLRSVKETLALSPENVTIHALCRKKSADETSERAFSTRFVQAVLMAHRLCINEGLEPYYLYRQKMSDADLENLGFAKKGTLSLYNLAMMEDLCDVFACGAGAIGKLLPKENGGKIRRFAAYKYPFEYLSHPERMQARLEEMSR